MRVYRPNPPAHHSGDISPDVRPMYLAACVGAAPVSAGDISDWHIPDGATTAREIVESIPPEISPDTHPEVWQRIETAIDEAISSIGKQQRRDIERERRGLPTDMGGNGGGKSGAGSGGRPWHHNYNKSVNADFARLRPSEISAMQRAVNEAWKKHGDKLRLPMSSTHGQTIRRDYARISYMEGRTAPLDPEDPFDNGHAVSEIHTVDPLTWAQSIRRLLVRYFYAENTTIRLRFGHKWEVSDRRQTDAAGRTETVAGKPVNLPPNAVVNADVSKLGKTFDVPATLRWQPEYQKRYAAQIDAWTREYCGGVRPSGGECEGAYSDPYVSLITLTASAKPEGEYIGPVDHLQSLRDSWDTTYHALRNAMVRAGFESHQWTYDRRAEPHRGDRGGGVNVGYGHEHVVLITDGPVSHADLTPVIDTHVRENPYAGEAAHGRQSTEIKAANELTDVASYVADYCSIEARPLTERSPAYLMWAAAATACGYRTVSRSDSATQAVKADMCKQRYESEESLQDRAHGEQLAHKHGKIVCAACGSYHGIQQTDTIAEKRLMADGGLTANTALSVKRAKREIWKDTPHGGRVGLPPVLTAWHKRVDEIDWSTPEDTDISVSEIYRRAIDEWEDLRYTWKREHLEDIGPIDEEALRLARVYARGMGHMEYTGEPIGWGEPTHEPDGWHIESVETYGDRRPASAGGGVETVDVINWRNLFAGLFDPDGRNTCGKCGSTFDGAAICDHIAGGTWDYEDTRHQIQTRAAAARVIYRHDCGVSLKDWHKCNRETKQRGCNCGAHVLPEDTERSPTG